jgi:hypothetical protein
MDISKIRQPDAELVGELSRRIQRLYVRFVSEFEGSDTYREVKRLIEIGDIPSAIDLIEEAFEEAVSEVAELTQDTYKAYLLLLGASLGVKLRLDITSDPLLDMIRSNRGTLVQRIRQGQRDATNRAIVDSYTNGAGVTDAVLQSVGLSGASMKAVHNYRDSLLRQNTTNDVKMGDAEIERMVEAYRRKMYRNRGEVIGYATAVRAFAESQQLAMDTAIEQGEVDPQNVTRVWNRVADDRVRDAHNVMHGQTAGIDESFIDGSGNELMYPGDPKAPIGTTINCRCWLTFKIK